MIFLGTLLTTFEVENNFETAEAKIYSSLKSKHQIKSKSKSLIHVVGCLLISNFYEQKILIDEKKIYGIHFQFDL